MIHAFAQSRRAAFPMESGVAPGFAALDERSTEVLKRRVLAEVLVEAERTGDPILDDFRAISVRMGDGGKLMQMRSEEHTSELQSLMRISYAVFCLKKKNKKPNHKHTAKP